MTMKRLRAAAWVVVVAILTACASAPRTPIATCANCHPERLVGTWDVYISSARFTISHVDNAYYITGIDTLDGEHFQLSSFSWNGIRLVGKKVMPSTGWTTYSSLRFTAVDRMEGSFRGDQKPGKEIWIRNSDPKKRTEVQEANLRR